MLTLRTYHDCCLQRFTLLIFLHKNKYFFILFSQMQKRIILPWRNQITKAVSFNWNARHIYHIFSLTLVRLLTAAFCLSLFIIYVCLHAITPPRAIAELQNNRKTGMKKKIHLNGNRYKHNNIHFDNFVISDRHFVYEIKFAVISILFQLKNLI